VFYIIAAAERADANSGKVDQNIQYKSEEDVARNIKSTRSFQDNRAPSELHKMDVDKTAFKVGSLDQLMQINEQASKLD